METGRSKFDLQSILGCWHNSSGPNSCKSHGPNFGNAKKIHQGQVKVYCCFLSIYKQTWHFLELRKGCTQNDVFSSWHGQVPSYFAQIVWFFILASTLQISLASPHFCCFFVFWIIFPQKCFGQKNKLQNRHDLVDWSARPRLLRWCEAKRRCHPWAMRPSHLHTTLFCFQAHDPFCLAN